MRKIGEIEIGSAFSGVKSATIEGQIIRADGTVEELGVLAHSEFEPLKKRSAFERLTSRFGGR